MAHPTAVILKSDLMAASALQEQLMPYLPQYKFTTVARLADAKVVLRHSEVRYFFTGIGLADGDVIDLLYELGRTSSLLNRTAVVTHHHERRMLECLRQLRVTVVYDSASEPLETIGRCFEFFEKQLQYWSSSLRARLSPQKDRVLAQQLTPSEHLAFALFGDGCCDKVGAERLGLTVSSTRAIRRDLHSKLGAHDRSDLIRLAVQYGYVRFTSSGAIPVGLGILWDEYRQHRRRPSTRQTKDGIRRAA